MGTRGASVVQGLQRGFPGPGGRDRGGAGMMRNMDNFWVVSVEREAFGWRYSASRQGVVWAQGWFRSDTGEDEAFQMAWGIGKEVFHDANGQEISDRLLVYAKTVAATLG